MATNKEQNKLNVPHLRFPEFEGEWEKCKLGDIATGFDYGMNAPAKVFDGVNKYIRITDIDEASSTYNDSDIVSPDGTLTDTYLVNERDILLARTGASTGKSYLYKKTDGKLYFAGFLIRANVPEHNPYFVFSQLHTHRYWKWVSIMSARSGQPGINSQEYSTFPIYTTSIQEERKISKLLSLLDERIATQSKLIEDLKKLKSAIVEKVFCSPNQEHPMWRIEGFEQALSTYNMSDFSSRIATKNKESKCSLVLTIAAQYGLVNQESFFNKSVASENLTGYFLLHKGEFAYNRSYSAGYDWGAVKRLDNYDEGVLSTLYICFKINETIVDSDYLAYYFESSKWHKGLSDIAGEGARNHGLLNVSITDYFNTKHRFPVIEEQKAIAKMLNAITEKERKATLLGECYQKQKQYLLCQMFT
ncbi:restriction endonuclease subunit S [Segatella copri]|uniref:restriction endonuclease subunit S n=1 Tax=Segatella copri TaxID=165179 RepID=UPI002FF3796A